MYIVFDIGGTKMRVASSVDGESIQNIVKRKTPADDFDAGMRLLQETVEDVAGGEKITAIAGGVAGPLDREKTKLVNSPNISGWIEKPFKKSLEDAFNVPVSLENDSALVGLGEAVYGAGKGERIVAYITVSTGVGGARIVDGRIDESAFGFEPGHHIIDIHGGPCVSCKNPGDLESYVSGSAMEKRLGKKPTEITDEKIWDEYARILAYGLNNIAVLWSSHVIVLGGSMIVGDPAIPFESIREYFSHLLHIFPQRPELKKAELKDEGGLYGALAYAKQNM